MRLRVIAFMFLLAVSTASIFSWNLFESLLRRQVEREADPGSMLGILYTFWGVGFLIFESRSKLPFTSFSLGGSCCAKIHKIDRGRPKTEGLFHLSEG